MANVKKINKENFILEGEIEWDDLQNIIDKLQNLNDSSESEKFKISIKIEGIE